MGSKTGGGSVLPVRVRPDIRKVIMIGEMGGCGLLVLVLAEEEEHKVNSGARLMKGERGKYKLGAKTTCDRCDF